jgi:2',3'-cyclic-nucleotide 2'-phosphodiesterase (5'-nucleotidase family)
MSSANRYGLSGLVRTRLLLLIVVLGCSSARTHEVPPALPQTGTILTFTDLRGTLKPCGCSKSLQRGGVDRIAWYLDAQRVKYPDAVVFHSGNLLIDDEGIPKSRVGQIDRRVEAIGASLRHMRVTATGLGPYDLDQGASWLQSALKWVPTPVVLTNAEAPEWKAIGHRHLIVTSGHIRIGVIGLVPKRPGFSDPLVTARNTAALLRKQGAHFVVALSSLGLRHSKRLLRRNSGIDVLVAAGQGVKALTVCDPDDASAKDEPCADEVEAFGSSWLVQSNIHGSLVGRLDLVRGTRQSARWFYKQPSTPRLSNFFGYSLSIISWDFSQHAAVAKVMKQYDSDLKAINLKVAGKLPPLAAGQASYVGVTACLECHEEVKPFWDNDKHKIAWATLERENKTFDLECVSCHVTGYGKPGGAILGRLKNLKTVQCESCHGPGSIHAEEGDVSAIRRDPPKATCVTCHNPKHSTEFEKEYRTYRKKLIVEGHGR